MTKKILMLCMIIMLFGTGCFSKKEEAKQPETNNNAVEEAVVISENVKVVKAEEFDKFIDAAYDYGSNEIKVSKDCEKKFVKGDILNRGISEKFPIGLMKKIEKVEDKGDYKIYTVTAASISDVIENGTINLEKEIMGKDIVSTDFKYKGVTLTAISEGTNTIKKSTSAMTYSMVLGFKDAVLYDGDNSDTTTDDQLIFNGNLKVKPKAKLEVSIKKSYDPPNAKAKAEFYIENFLEGELSLKGSSQMEWNKEVSVGTVKFGAVPINIGPVIFIFVPSIEFLVGTTGKIKGKMKLSAIETIHTKAWGKYAHERKAEDFLNMTNKFGTWDADLESEKSFKFYEPEFDASAEAKVYTGIKGKITCDGVIGFYGRVNAYLRGEADIAKDPWWDLYGGLEGVVGAESFDILPSFEKKFNIVEGKINSASGAYNIEENGNVDLGWAKRYSRETYNTIENSFQINKTVEYDDGSLLAIGHSMKGPYNGFIMKTDKTGNRVWEKWIKDYIRDAVKIKDNKVALLINGDDEQINPTNTLSICEIDKDGIETRKKLVYNGGKVPFFVNRDSRLAYNKLTDEIVVAAFSGAYNINVKNLTDCFYVMTIKDGVLVKVKNIKVKIDNEYTKLNSFDVRGMEVSDSGEILLALSYACTNKSTNKNTDDLGGIILKLDKNIEKIWFRDICVSSELGNGISFGWDMSIHDIKVDKDNNIYFNLSKSWSKKTEDGHFIDQVQQFLVKFDSAGNEVFTTMLNPRDRGFLYFTNDDFRSYVFSYGTGLKLAVLSNGDIIMAGTPGYASTPEKNSKFSEMYKFEANGSLVYYRQIAASTGFFILADIHEDFAQKGIYISGALNGLNSLKTSVDYTETSAREPYIFYANLDGNIDTCFSDGRVSVKNVSIDMYTGILKNRTYYSPTEISEVVVEDGTANLVDEWRERVFENYDVLKSTKL